MPNLPWVVMILVLAPAISLLGIGVTVVISSRVKGFREAQQLSALMVVPVLALLFGQAAGFLVMGGRMILLLSAVVLFLAFLVFRFGLSLFQRENILAKSN
jgi:ABC-2 type transport system permease protein